MFEIRNAVKEEKENRRIEDLALTTIGIRNEISREEKVNILLQYRLEQNYPNPFNPVTKINFSLPKTGFATLKVYDAGGREIADLINKSLTSGSYEYVFDGSELSSGIYFYTLKVSDYSQTKKMMLLK